jgi:hypothetical protein
MGVGSEAEAAMGETTKELCERAYREAASDLQRFEATWIRETFAAYGQAEEESSRLFLPEETKFSGPTLRRGVLEKRIAGIIGELGGHPQFTNAKGRENCGTSHYSVFRLGMLDILISSVTDEQSTPRYADYRQKRIAATEALLAFMDEEAPSDDAQLTMFFKHGKDEIDSGVPQFAMFEVLDPNDRSVWRRNVLKEQRGFVESLLNVREENVPEDEGVPRLRKHLRRLDGTA